MILAGIDIGSNAARLLIVDAQKKSRTDVVFNKVNFLRVPLRLGLDVFKQGIIGKEREKMLINTMQSFKFLMNAYNVQAVKACATSAMRDARNRKHIINEVKKRSDIDIEIISGDKEATLVFETHIAENLSDKKSYLYIDVGGGSTEVDFFVNGKQIYQHSYNIGTIRLLQKTVKENDWEDMKKDVKKNINTKLPVIAIGSGGNINKIFSLSKTKEGLPLYRKQLNDYYNRFSALTIEERIQKYDLKTDRADVIVPALQIYINLMRWTRAEEIIVPKIGVSDGLVRELWNDIATKKKR